MSKEIINSGDANFLITTNENVPTDKRIFFASENIDIFPCSRRGQYKSTPVVEVYDPEARLNTERTNRLRTAINGFTDQFIVDSEFKDNKLTFVLAGYRIEVRNINLDLLSSKLFSDEEATTGSIYAHLSLHDKVSLMVDGYFTEILYRQSTEDSDQNSLDVSIEADSGKFFVGVSFTNNPNCRDFLEGRKQPLPPHDLLIFNVTKENGEWSGKLAQTSLLPKIEHGETENSVKIPGDFIVENDLAVEGTAKLSNGLEVTGQITANNDLTVEGAATLNNNLNVTGEVSILSGLTSNNLQVNQSATIATLEVIGNTYTNSLEAVTSIETPELIADEVSASKITQNGAAVPAIALEQDGDIYKLQITLDASKKQT